MVGEDWQAVLLWKALFEAGVYTNVALHPAVPPGGALLRTSLMATHERDHIDRALEIFEKVIQDFPDLPARASDEVAVERLNLPTPARPELRRARNGGGSRSPECFASPAMGSFSLSIFGQGIGEQEKLALSERLGPAKGGSDLMSPGALVSFPSHAGYASGQEATGTGMCIRSVQSSLVRRWGSAQDLTREIFRDARRKE